MVGGAESGISLLPAPRQQRAAVNHVGAPGDPASLLRRQEQHQMGHVLGRAQPTQRVAAAIELARQFGIGMSLRRRRATSAYPRKPGKRN